MADSPLQQDWDVVSWALSGEYDPERPILVDADDPERYLSKRSAATLIARLTGAFPSGSTVCVHLYNDILYPILVLGILASGCEWTGTNPAYTSAELTHHLSGSQARYVVTDGQYLDVVRSAIESSGEDIEVVLFTDITSAEREHGTFTRTLHDLLASESDQPARYQTSISPDGPAAVMSTSGTTGKPKMVCRSHRSLVMETQNSQDNDREKPYQVRRLYCTPIFHAFSFPEMVINTLRLGYPSFYMRRFDGTFASKVCEFGITETMGAPAMLLRIAERCAEDEKEKTKLQSLRKVLCAGAPLPAHLRSAVLQLFDDAALRIVQVWGMSEGGWFATFWYPEHDATGSVGRPLPGYHVRVGDTSGGVELANGRRAGELLVSGHQPTSKYKGNEVATHESFHADGWLRTGDIGYVEDGRVYLVDRAKDIIKVNGWTVSPAELEAVLYQMPGIKDAAALSCGHGTDEHAAMFVVPRTAGGVSREQVMRHLLTRVARFKIATCSIHLVDHLPRSASGKVVRSHLRHMLDVL